LADISYAFSADTSGLLDGLHEIDLDLQKIAASLGALTETSALTGAALSKMAEDTSKTLEKLGEQGAKLGKNLGNAGAGLGKAFAPIEKGFSTMVGGLLRGTETWHQAVMRGLQTMVTAELQADAKILQSKIMTNLKIGNSDSQTASHSLLDWIFSEDAKTNATEVGAEARASAQQAGESQGLLSTIGNAIKAITADAGKVFGGIFGFLAPEMGPAAAGPASAGSAMVLAELPTLSAAGGAWDLPGDTLLMAHARESVLPAHIAEPMRDFFTGSARGGGPPDIHLHVNAVDARSVRQLLLDNHSAVGEALHRAWRNGNPRVR
jgi:hypothetical protein